MFVTDAFRMGFSLWSLLLLLLPNDAAALSRDGWALLQFRSVIEDDPTCALFDWNPYDEDPCRWFGIRCENGVVASINLTWLSLKGTLAPELGQLTSLRELLLRGNDLMGVIPFQFGELENLEVLDLAYNKLTGQLPQDLGNLSSLDKIYLENNSLEGTIPSDLGKLRNMDELSISVNKLRGTIVNATINTPASNRLKPGGNFGSRLCCMKCLQTADFSGNYFEGELPSCLHHLPRLSFYHNCLSSEGLQHQRSLEDCLKRSVTFSDRVLFTVEGDAEVLSTSSSNTTNQTTIWGLSFEPSPAPSEASPAPSPSEPSPALLPSEPSLAPAPALAPAQAKESSSPRASRLSMTVLAAVFSSLAVVLLIGGVSLFLRYRHKGAAVRPWKSSMSGELQKDFEKGVPAISRVELEAACEGFSNIIGSSSNIVLFKGTLANGKEIAVTSIRKSAKSWSSNSELIFWRMVESLSRMDHHNLVNLIGYCTEEVPFVRMLVFEYVANGTAFEHLHNKESEHLDWGTRMRIIMGVADALEYMHHGLGSPISHTKLDAKAVYLTEDYSAKLADFGVWKVSSLKKDAMISSQRTNAFGIDDLELSDRHVPDLDSNISDFGVFLLEMVSGRPPLCKELGSLREWAMDYLGPLGLIDRIIDPTLKAYNPDELKVIGNLVIQCLQDTSKDLTMKQITAHLHSSLGPLDEPAVPKSSQLLWAELEILSQE